MPTATALPRWDLADVYPGLDSEAFLQDFEKLQRMVANLEASIVSTGIAAGETPNPTATWDSFEAAYSELFELMRTVATYVSMHVTTDSRNELAQARESELQQLGVHMRKIDAKVTAWIGKLNLDALDSDSARHHRFFLEITQEMARHQMSPAEEDLAAELRESGGMAWAKLHGNITSQIEVEVRGERLPMPAVRNLAYDSEDDVRREAYFAELAAWKCHEIPLAAAMNSIKGEVGRLARRRGWDSALDLALFEARIDRPTLEAMMGAAKDAMPVFRRYLRAKAKRLGKEKLPWWDLFAPLPGVESTWPWPKAMDFVEQHFRSYSDRLADFTRMSFEEGWTDAEPRSGKRDGAFCIGLRPGESRILMNFKPAFGSVSTLAHELGHAYHNLCLQDRLPLQRSTPMTLAETASIFCETLIRQAGLSQGTADERAEILEASLQGATQTVVDITSRFIYEQHVFDKRSERELSAREHCELMRQAQLETYGDGLDPEFMHPYMWGVKPHYYNSSRSFYNFPYMFGLLFGLGLFAIYQEDAEGFKSRYDELLSSTGLAQAAELAKGFGIDIRDWAFWAKSLSVIAQDVDRFEGS